MKRAITVFCSLGLNLALLPVLMFGAETVCFESDLRDAQEFHVWTPDTSAKYDGDYFGECFNGGGSIHIRRYVSSGGVRRFLVVYIRANDPTTKPDVQVESNGEVRAHELFIGKKRLQFRRTEYNGRRVNGVIFDRVFYVKKD